MSAKPTPGPWRWEVNEVAKQIQLCGGNPKGGFGAYDLTVMDFVRWGMGGAAPRFVDRGRTHPVLVRAEAFGIVAPNRGHHAKWFKLIDNPDANLIAAAPELLEALKPLAAWADDPRNKPTLQEAERAKAVFARALGGDHA